MSLRDIPLKQWYDSDEDDILTDFLIPTLSNSIKYDRLVGFFSSSCLAVAARGILPFIKNQGKMRIITSPKFSQQDIIEIEKSVDKLKSITERNLLSELDIMEPGFFHDHVKALGWLLKAGALEIKIVVPYEKNEDGIFFNENLGMYHQKVGLFTDSYGNKISFSGSDNESKTARALFIAVP